MINWIKQNKLELLIVLIILAIAAFLRFYRLSEYMTFLGDEGRDALMVKRILVERDLPLIGPPTSVGNIYLGPLYYYMMAIPMTVFWLNPVAAAGMTAFIGVFSVGLVYYLARKCFGKIPAFLAAIPYAISVVNIVNSRSSWNPSPTPFFALLAFLGFHLAKKYNNHRFLILTGGALAAAVQMHYFAAVLLLIFGILWFYEVFTKNKHYFWQGTIGAVVVFILFLSPLVIFDLRHNFLNYHAITSLFTNKNVNQNFDSLNSIVSIIPNYSDKLVGRYIAIGNKWLTILASIIIIIPLGITFRKWLFGKSLRWPYLALSIWLFVGIFGVSFYRGEIYDHYLSFLSPAIFLLLAAFAALFKLKLQFVMVLILVLTIGFLNLSKNPLLHPPNNQLQRTKDIAKFVISEAKDKPFNFALIAQRNYDAAYQFYLDMYGHKPEVVPFQITDQLFVVCEDAVCDPIYNPKYEIAAFGWAKIEKTSSLLGVKVYKLVPNPSGKPS